MNNFSWYVNPEGLETKFMVKKEVPHGIHLRLNCLSNESNTSLQTCIAEYCDFIGFNASKILNLGVFCVF